MVSWLASSLAQAPGSRWKYSEWKTTGFWRPGWLGRWTRRLAQEALFRNYVAKWQVHGGQAGRPWVQHQMTSVEGVPSRSRVNVGLVECKDSLEACLEGRLRAASRGVTPSPGVLCEADLIRPSLAGSGSYKLPVDTRKQTG